MLLIFRETLLHINLHIRVFLACVRDKEELEQGARRNLQSRTQGIYLIDVMFLHLLI
jgi:hypothetical protein